MYETSYKHMVQVELVVHIRYLDENFNSLGFYLKIYYLLMLCEVNCGGKFPCMIFFPIIKDDYLSGTSVGNHTSYVNQAWSTFLV